MFRRIVLLVGGLALLVAVSSSAQEAVLSQEYGSGVHAYFTGDYVSAYERLTSAVEKGSKDPRAFYFRGLACLQLGRRPDAILDFRQGAELESKDVNKFYDVGKSLERVQGAARSELETYRVQARMAALEEEQRLRKARYEAVRREESRVLREQSGEETTEENPFKSGSESANSEDDSNPFGSGEESQPKKPKSAGKKKKAEASGTEDPFATEPEKPADKTEKPAKKDDKKKDGKKKDAGDGKDDKEGKKGAKETKPDDKEKKPDAEDPFAPDEKNDKEKSEKKGEKKDEKPDASKKPADKKDEKKDDKKDEKKGDKKNEPEDPFA